MGRFSPTIVPDYNRDPGEDLARAFEAFEASRAAQRAEKQSNRRGEIADILSGYRPGDIPAEQPEVPPMVTPRPGVDLGSVLGDPRGAAALPRISLGDALGSQEAPPLARPPEPTLGGGLSGVRGPGPSLADAMRGAPMGDAPMLERGNLRPGAFDPVSGTFATSRGRPAEPKPITPTGPANVSRGTSAERYVPVPGGGYVDLQGSAAFARALADMESRRAIADENNAARAALAEENNRARAALADGKVQAPRGLSLGMPGYEDALRSSLQIRNQNRPPARPSTSSNTEQNQARAVVRQFVQEARRKYLAGERDALGNTTGQLGVVDAERQARADAEEIYGAEAVNDAMGKATPTVPPPPPPSALDPRLRNMPQLDAKQLDAARRDPEYRKYLEALGYNLSSVK